ncbi:hypothetical protein [Haloechinothrix salitolerans]|uniref:Secreted protein n=1 Tax=Haloechinothrix salitolerans TaxID=926830 RepID=A0ABW2C2D6_9PSEU
MVARLLLSLPMWLALRGASPLSRLWLRSVLWLPTSTALPGHPSGWLPRCRVWNPWDGPGLGLVVATAVGAAPSAVPG